MPEDSINLLDTLIAKAKRAGADSADALIFETATLSHARRLGQVERMEREESRDLGLRVFLGKRQASVSSTDLASGAVEELVERALAMAKVVPEDPYCGLAPEALLSKGYPEIDIRDAEEPSVETLIERARRCEEAALAVNGVTNSEGAEASWGLTTVTLATSGGFSGSYARTGHSLGVAVLAGEGLGMERDYEFSSTVYGGDLDDPGEVGRKAGEKAVRRLGPRKPKTAGLPVIFDPRVSGSLIGSFAGAINGSAIARGTSFLKDSMGERIFSDRVTIIDDPHRARGLRSKPFDGEGVANRRRNLIETGRLQTWILDLSSARQLGLESTGHASRGTGGPPSPSATNLYMAPGEASPEEIISGIAEGFYVTEMMGMGANLVTGDYSRGAAGFWIEKGELTYPVSEATVAGHLKEIFRHITPANDLVFKYGTNAPTVLVEGMTVAGN
jgi:PmbA protein